MHVSSPLNSCWSDECGTVDMACFGYIESLDSRKPRIQFLAMIPIYAVTHAAFEFLIVLVIILFLMLVIMDGMSIMTTHVRC